MLLNVIGGPATLRRDAAPAHRQPRGPLGPAAAHPARSDLPRAAGGRRGRAPARARRDGRQVRLTVDLQRDFALNQPLSPFALAALELLDDGRPTYALDVVSVIEATLENPRQVLSAQQFKARGEAVAEMKAEGSTTRPGWICSTRSRTRSRSPSCSRPRTRIYRRGHPWVADHERAQVGGPRHVRAGDDVRRVHRLVRTVPSEGLVLRYLADAYKALRQTVPDEGKTEELIDLIEWLGELVRQVDSSLIDEWERLLIPRRCRDRDRQGDRPPAVTSNIRAFRVLVRNACSAGWSSRRCAVTTSSGSSTPRPAGMSRRGPMRLSRTSTSTTR